MPTDHQTADLIVSGRYLMPNHLQAEVVEEGGVAIVNDRIVAVGSRRDLQQSYPGTAEIHEPDGLIMPGLINTHTHASMSCLRGFADDLPLMSWLQDHIFPIEAQLDGETVYQSALLSMAEMIKSGTTSFCDMYLFAKDVARAAEQSGMRSWLGEVLYDFPSPSYGELASGISYVQEMLEHYQNHPLIKVTVDPHSVYTCAPSLLEKCAEMADAHECLLVTHLSETQFEVDTCLEQFGRTPVQHLDRLQLLTERTLAAHCVKLGEEDMEVLSEKRVKVSHCLESNMKLASGIAPIPELIKRGVTVSIGTDGSASNNDVDMFSEMSLVAKAHKAITMDPTVMGAETTLEAATAGGAEALGCSLLIGSLETGKKADLIVLDLNQPHLTPLYNIPSHLVYAARGADVIHSIIDGKIVMQDRRLLTIDEQQVMSDMGITALKLQEIGKKNQS